MDTENPGGGQPLRKKERNGYRMGFLFKSRHLSSFQIIIIGFVAVILAGSLLLMLPCSTREAGGASFTDALFTSTSAVCVTGLVVHDTVTYWSLFGQAVILVLIQIGGMGVVTVAVSVAIISGKKIGLMQRSTMQEAISAPQMGGIIRLTGFIIRSVILIELIGAVALATVFCREFGIWKGIWYSVFHSISAFCNAGFDLMGFREQFSSLTAYTGQPVVNLTIMLLIITGGLGFLTWDDIRTNGFRLRRYRMQSKVILTVTGILILLPALFYYFVEFSPADWPEMTASERIWASLFQTVTPRTAGFNTVDLTQISQAGLMIMILLMLIGGATGSTAGGIKTTTVAVLFASAVSVFRRRAEASCFGRRIAGETVRHASAILLMYLVLFFGGGIAVSAIEDLPILTALFETGSAVGTVGLSLGATPDLGTASRLILIALMFFGRVGGLTLIYAAVSGVRPDVSRLPQEKINVG